MKKDLKTDWTSYYKNPRNKWSTFTQQFTLKRLEEIIKNHFNKGIKVLEIGGGASCFAEQLCSDLFISSYEIIDNNEEGIKRTYLFRCSDRICAWTFESIILR